MRCTIISGLLVIMFSVLGQAFAVDAPLGEGKAKGITKRVIILPFYNYTDSGIKYLETYIAEVMKDNMSIDHRIKLQDASELFDKAIKNYNKSCDETHREILIIFFFHFNIEVFVMPQ